MEMSWENQWLPYHTNSPNFHPNFHHFRHEHHQIHRYFHHFHCQVEEALGSSMGSGDVFEAELQHVAALAACAANMRVFEEGKWKSDVGPLEKMRRVWKWKTRNG